MVRIFSGKRSRPNAIPLRVASTAVQAAKKSHPAIMIELLIVDLISMWKRLKPSGSDDELSAFARRVHQEQKLTAPGEQALPGLRDAACVAACALHGQLPSASAAPSDPQ